MTFDEMIAAAEGAAKGQNALGRILGGSHNLVRQWKAGMSLPSKVAQEAILAGLIGRTPGEVHEIIWQERRRRWEARRHVSLSVPAKPPMMVRHARLPRQAMLAGR